mmetsp:Transcript_21158/g.49165  ORF Transcript_21158/g.49165 Transcript_21158/m.49165 type:complete len:232 (+) Transcript_21158:188-883(+)
MERLDLVFLGLSLGALLLRGLASHSHLLGNSTLRVVQPDAKQAQCNTNSLQRGHFIPENGHGDDDGDAGLEIAEDLQHHSPHVGRHQVPRDVQETCVHPREAQQQRHPQATSRGHPVTPRQKDQHGLESFEAQRKPHQKGARIGCQVVEQRDRIHVLLFWIKELLLHDGLDGPQHSRYDGEGGTFRVEVHLFCAADHEPTTNYGHGRPSPAVVPLAPEHDCHKDCDQWRHA